MSTQTATNAASTRVALAALLEPLDARTPRIRGCEARTSPARSRCVALGRRPRSGSGSCRRATRARRGRRRPRSPSGIRDGQRRLGRPAAGEDAPGARTAGAPRRDSRSWLQAMAPRSVRWRSGRSRAPPARSRLRPSRSRIERRAEEPDARRGQLDAPAAGRRGARRSPGSSPAPRRRGRGPGGARGARSTNSATPASTSSGGTGCPRSPPIRSSSRLVTRTRTSGAPRTMRATTSRRRPAAAARGCRGRAASCGRGGATRSASSTGSLGRLAHADRRRDRRLDERRVARPPPGRRTRRRAGSGRGRRARRPARAASCRCRRGR